MLGSKRKYGSLTAFLDVLFITMLAFYFMFTISFLLIAPEKESPKNISTKAEFLITLRWDAESSDDIDIWVEDPNRKVLWFNNKNVGLMHLDRDDVGTSRDMVELPTGETVEYKYNQELVTIRGVIPGEWVINIHMYAKRTEKPTSTTISMDKLNPAVRNIFKQKFMLSVNREELTVARVGLSSNGNVLYINNIPKSLVKETHIGNP